ncbi:MAG: hypothetical protein IJP35_07745 [Clostridia bacterium]|nr:hypothetical protein [Clostridia bacterium]
MKTKRLLAWVLTVVMAISCLTVLPFAVSAETAPTVDGVKDDVYTDAKMLEITTAYDAGGSGAAKTNTDGMVMKVYYTWDATDVYVFVDVTDPSATTGPDYVYFVNNTEQNAGFIFQDPNGGYIQFNADGTAGSGGAVVPAEYKVNRAAGSNNRSYELRYALGANATGGFRISPAATNGAYGVCYTGAFGQNAGAKQVVFNNESTWYEQKLEKVAEEDTSIDCVKDERYADTKKVTISTMFTGDHGNAIDNTDGLKANAWFAWDDNYNYMYVEIADPNGAAYIDAIYLKNNLNEPTGGFIFQQSGGAYLQNVLGGALTKDGVIELYKHVAETGVRKYELKFTRDAAATGFHFNVCSMKTNSNVISSGKDINTTSMVAVKYADESTWVQNFVPEGGEEPTPPDEPVVPPPTPSEDGLDAIKDERYTEEKCTTISTAYGGSGGGRIINRHHIYTKLYYAWDDNFNYVYFEIHDPFMTQGIDLLYYITNTNAAAGFMFQQAGGGYLQWDTATGNMTGAADADGREIKYASYVGDGVRQYEVVLPKTAGAIGLQLSPVAYRENGSYSVSYDTNYYMLPNKNINYENLAGHWTDDMMTDADVMTDPTQIEAIEAELAKLPEDASTLTYENDYDLVTSVGATLDAVPDSWLVFIDEALYERYLACRAKMDELEAAVRGEELIAIEAKIDALPDDADLDDLEAVEEIRELIANLGGLVSYINPEKMARFNTVAKRVDALCFAVKIDGKKDPSYERDDAWSIEQGYLFSSQSDIYLTPTDSYGVIQTAADENYFYIYFEVFDDNGIVFMPDEVEWNTGSAMKFDSLFAYIDPDPMNIVSGKPYQDVEFPTDGLFNFYMMADGTVPAGCLNAKNQFLTDPSNFVGFNTGNTYGFEMRVPRVEGEESFKLNIVFYDPIYDAATGELDPLSMQIALGAEWSYNYVGYGEKFFDDYPEFMNYLEVIETIEKLPAAESIEVYDKALDRKAQKAKEALALLNEDQRAYITDEIVQHLDAVLAALEAAPMPVEGVIGDVDGNGKVEATDALEVLKAVVGKVTLTDEQLVLADTDGNGEVDATDALNILKKVVGKIDKFPVEQ